MGRYLVTGGAGFIGSHLCRRLIKKGHSVICLDDFSTGKRENLEGLIGVAGFVLVEGDIRDNIMCAKLIAQSSGTFHLAAVASVQQTIERPLESHAVNDTAFLHIMEGSRAAGNLPVVFASSCAVYGDAPGFPKREEMPLSPMSPYAVAKHANELYANCYTRLHGLPTVGLRFFNVFGPNQDPGGAYSGVIARFAWSLASDGKISIYGDGNQTRDFVYVADAVHAMEQAMERSKILSGRVFNIGSGTSYSVNDILAYLEEMTGVKARVEKMPQRQGDIKRSAGDISRARSALDFQPTVQLGRGLKMTYEYYKEFFTTRRIC